MQDRRIPEAIPEWVNETPDECSYDLIMFDAGGGSEEEIHLSRAEYIALKKLLAAMRGYNVWSAVDCLKELRGKPLDPENNVIFSPNEDQAALSMLTARAAYRLLPQAVVTTNEDFEAKLRELAEDPPRSKAPAEATAIRGRK
jgi:hypothetical protein